MSGYLPLFDSEKLKLPTVGPSRTKLLAGLGAALAFVTVAGLVFQGRRHTLIAYSAATADEVDPFSLPGYLDFSRDDDPLATNWIPFDKNVAPAPNWVQLLRKAADLPWPEIAGPRPASEDAAEKTKERIQLQALQEIDHLRDRTILLIGDSVDRNLVIQTSELLGVRDRIHAGHYENLHDEDPRDWDIRGLPHVLHIDEPQVNFTLANCFIYGVDENNDFEHQKDWHPPGKAEDRITTLCKPMTDQLAHPPSLIQLHSGLWDCSLFGREDRRNPDPAFQTSERPLSKEQLQWWQGRMVSIIKSIKRTWPGVPIVYRKLHRTRSPEEAWQWTSGQEHLGFTNWFVDVRIAQIRDMQEEVASAEELRIFDFGKVWEGFQDYQDGVHPRTLPGGAIMSRALLHNAYLAYQAGSRKGSV